MTRTRNRRSSSRRPAASVGKPHGVLHPRVQHVGPEHFGILCFDCANVRSKFLRLTSTAASSCHPPSPTTDPLSTTPSPRSAKHLLLINSTTASAPSNAPDALTDSSKALGRPLASAPPLPHGRATPRRRSDNPSSLAPSGRHPPGAVPRTRGGGETAGGGTATHPGRSAARPPSAGGHPAVATGTSHHLSGSGTTGRDLLASPERERAVMHRLGCQREDHPQIGRRQLLQVGGLGLLGAGLSDLLRLEAQARRPPYRADGPRRSSSSFNPVGHRSTKPSIPNRPRPTASAASTAPRKLDFPECGFVNICRAWPLVPTVSALCGRCTTPPIGNSAMSISAACISCTPAAPRCRPAASSGRRSLRSSHMQCLPSRAPVCPLPSSCRAVNLMTYPGRGAGVLGSRHERWGVDLAPPCHAPDPAGSCPNCFSHDNPNDPARSPGKGPKVLVGQQQTAAIPTSIYRTSGP